MRCWSQKDFEQSHESTPVAFVGRSEDRAHRLLEALCARIAVPPDAFSLAELAIDERDRVHRASDMRAGAIAALLQRVRAAEDTARFEQLLCVCTYDYAAYEGHSAAEYPKAPRLRAALAAYLQPAVDSLSGEAALEARAESIARGLGSLAQ